MGSLLLLLLDSRSPAGGHNHSGGLEAAVTAGYVRDVDDVEDFCRGRLRTTGRVNAAAAAAAARLASVRAEPRRWLALDAEISARTPSPAARAASRQLGAGLRRLVRAMLPHARLDEFWTAIAPAAPHHPLVLGAACAAAAPGRGAPALAARATALGTCTAPASAGVRLLGLDPYAVHAMLARLTTEIDAVAADASAPQERAARNPASEYPGGEYPDAEYPDAEYPDAEYLGADYLGAENLPADGAPALDLLADVHATAEVRLFAS